MNADIFNTIWLAASFLALFGLAELLYHYFSIKAEYTRKLVHFGTGALTLLFPVFLTSHWWVLILCSSFAGILLLSLKYNLLKSINAVDRVTWGSLCYPLSVYICFLVYEKTGNRMILFYLPILILAVCDPLAALVGKRWPIVPYSVWGNRKSLAGSFTFLGGAIILCILGMQFIPAGTDIRLIRMIAVALTTTVAEAVSNKGFDNLLIPGTALLTLISGIY